MRIFRLVASFKSAARARLHGYKNPPARCELRSAALKARRALLEKRLQALAAILGTKTGHLPANLLVQGFFELLATIAAERLLDSSRDDRRRRGEAGGQEHSLLIQAVVRNNPRHETNPERIGSCNRCSREDQFHRQRRAHQAR